MTNSEMANIFSSLKDEDVVSFKPGKLVKGIIFSATKKQIIVQLPGGNTGIVPKKEMTGYEAEEDLAEGVEVEVLVLDSETEKGILILSMRRANQETLWSELGEIHNEKRMVKVKVIEANKGGLMTLYKGLRAFLPVSQLTPANYPRVDGADTAEILKKLGAHIGKEFTVQVITIDPNTQKLVVSEKATMEEKRQETLNNIQAGDVVEGIVTGIVKFGIFVEFGGVEGLVHLSELDWEHVSNPGDKFKLGQRVEVLVLGKENQKLSFSVKRLSEDPWKDKVMGYEVGKKVSSGVIRWNSNGVFVEISEGITGAFSLADFGVEDYTKLKIKEGELVEGIIEAVDYESHKILLKKV